MYIPKTLQEENVHNNYLMGLIFSKSWRVAPMKNFFPYGDLDFVKKNYKSIGSSIMDFWAKFWCFQKIRLKGFLLKIDPPPHVFEQNFEIFRNFV